MTDNSSAIEQSRVSPLASGTGLAALGVLCFSFSFPATAWALGGFGAWSATGLRGTLAALIAAAALLATRAPVPARGDWAALAVVAGGCAIGFPLLTALALQTSSTAHSAVVVGALLVCAAGYAEGGRLSARMPGWRVIAWGVVLAAPVNLIVAAWALPHEPVHLTARALAGLAYIAGISQFGGFVLWYRGMGLIGVERASQLQLAQPLLTIVWAVLLLGEHLTPAVPLTAVVVLACIAVTQRARA